MTNTNKCYLTFELEKKSYKINMQDLEYLHNILEMFEAHNGSEDVEKLGKSR